MQSVHITTKVVSSSPAHGEMSSILYHGMKFVSDLQLVGGFSGYSGPPKKTDHHETTGNMFKGALNTITLIQIFLFFMGFWFVCVLLLSILLESITISSSKHITVNRIGGVIVSVIGFRALVSPNKTHMKLVCCCFSSNHITLRCRSKEWIIAF